MSHVNAKCSVFITVPQTTYLCYPPESVESSDLLLTFKPIHEFHRFFKSPSPKQTCQLVPFPLTVNNLYKEKRFKLTWKPLTGNILHYCITSI